MEQFFYNFWASKRLNRTELALFPVTAPRHAARRVLLEPNNLRVDSTIINEEVKDSISDQNMLI